MRYQFRFIFASYVFEILTPAYWYKQINFTLAWEHFFKAVRYLLDETGSSSEEHGPVSVIYVTSKFRSNLFIDSVTETPNVFRFMVWVDFWLREEITFSFFFIKVTKLSSKYVTLIRGNTISLSIGGKLLEIFWRNVIDACAYKRAQAAVLDPIVNIVATSWHFLTPTILWTNYYWK